MHMHICMLRMHVHMYECLRREERLLREARRQRWDAREPSQQRLSEPAAVCSLGADCHEALEALLGRADDR